MLPSSPTANTTSSPAEITETPTDVSVIEPDVLSLDKKIVVFVIDSSKSRPAAARAPA